MNPVCGKCRHWGQIAWSRDSSGCQKASVKYGTDGYGPWKDSVACSQDSDYTVPENLFDPASEADVAQLNDRIKFLENEVWHKDHAISNLKASIGKLASGDCAKKEPGVTGG